MMKTAAVLAGLVCASSAAAQTESTEGLVSSLELEFETDSSVFADVAGERIEDTFRQRLEENIVAPGPWALEIENTLRIGDAIGEVRSESSIATSPTLIEGTYFATTSAMTPNESIVPQTRLFDQFELEAVDLDVIADIVLRVDGFVSTDGFGSSSINWAFITNGRGESGSFSQNAGESETFLFEDIDLTRFAFSFDTRISAGLDAPVLNSNASAQIEWSIEIIPIPSPGAGLTLAAAGLVGLRRRR